MEHINEYEQQRSLQQSGNEPAANKSKKLRYRRLQGPVIAPVYKRLVGEKCEQYSYKPGDART